MEKKNILDTVSKNVNVCSSPSELKITDIRVANINGAPKHCPLIKVYTNQGLVGYGEVRDASSATYALMLKSRFATGEDIYLAKGIENPLFKNGFVDVPNTPGLGIESLNEELLRLEVFSSINRIRIWQFMRQQRRRR